MAPKRQPPPQNAGPLKKQGCLDAGEEDRFHSTVQALRAALPQQRVIHVDSECPLHEEPGTQVRTGL